MAIQTRRGNYADFVPENLLEGEVASVLDKKYVYVGMPNGDAVQLGTMEKIEEVLEEAEGYRDSAKTYSESASASSTAASASKSAAKTSEDNAKTSETNAAASASTATTKASEASSSAQSASTSQSAAKTSEDNAKESETKAEASKDNAKSSEDNAKTSETNAKASEDAAVSAKNDAVTAKNTAVTKASEASASATESKSWAVGGTSSREAEDSNNSKYWSDKAKDYSDEAKAVATNQWSAIQNKPFSSIGANLSVDADGALNAEAGGAGSWNDLTGKPFSAIGDNLSVDSDGNLNADASGAWGSITGTLSDQTDLKNALDGKASASDVNSISSTIANAEDNGYLPKDGVSSMSNVELTEEVDTLSNEIANIDDKITLTQRTLLLEITDVESNKTYTFSENANTYKKLLIETSRGGSQIIDVDMLKVISTGSIGVSGYFSNGTSSFVEGFNGSVAVSNKNIYNFVVINRYLSGWSSSNIKVYGYK